MKEDEKSLLGGDELDQDGYDKEEHKDKEEEIKELI